MLRTASSLPLAGLLTLGSDPARFQTEPPACYRASWQLPGPDFHRQATTSLRTARSAATSQRHLPLCWAHEKAGLVGLLALLLLGSGAAALAATVPGPARTTSAKAKLATLQNHVKHDLSVQASHSNVPAPLPSAESSTARAGPAAAQGSRAHGVLQHPQAPFSPLEFIVSNAYFGQLGSQWVSVFAGAKRAGDGSLVSGGVWVYLGPVDVSSTAPTTDAGMFLAHSGPTELTIVSAHGLVLTLRDGHGQTLTFNLVTHKFN
jgi:hypothetical protein